MGHGGETSRCPPLEHPLKVPDLLDGARQRSAQSTAHHRDGAVPPSAQAASHAIHAVPRRDTASGCAHQSAHHAARELDGRSAIGAS
jgi:hypothetical protein